LGKAYLDMGNPKDAWRCWDVAKKHLPGHPSLMEVQDLERRLAMEYPEFL